MGSIITGKPKRGRGTIKKDPNYARSKAIVQSAKNLYQKPISAMIKAPAMTFTTILGVHASAMRGLGISKSRDETPFGHSSPDLSHMMHDTYVKNYGKQIKKIWDADVWKGDHKEGKKPYMQSGELIESIKKTKRD